jgi:hypothetical protein
MIRTMHEFIQSFKAARRVSTPFVAVRTPDPAGTIDAILSLLNGSAEETPVLHWDIMRGLAGVNNSGKADAQKLLGDGDPAMVSARPSDALALARRLPENAVLFCANTQRFVTDAVVVQGLWNLRDEFKADGRMLVMLTTPGATLPPELAQDVLVLDEPLPSTDDLRRIVTRTFGEASLPEPTIEVVEKAVDALIGLAAFPAEQAVAMSLSKSGLDTRGLWERKRQVIEQTPGLSVWRGGETFDDIGGVAQVKDFSRPRSPASARRASWSLSTKSRRPSPVPGPISPASRRK